MKVPKQFIFNSFLILLLWSISVKAQEQGTTTFSDPGREPVGLIPALKAINLNSATFEELVGMAKMSEEKARVVINYRKLYNKFQRMTEFAKIIGMEDYANLRKEVVLYALPDQIWEKRVAGNVFDLHIEQLTLRTFGLNGYAFYVYFPDGGNMLVDTGSAPDTEKLVASIRREITQGQDKYELSQMLGLKLRIDWVVLTSSSPRRSGGLNRILEEFKVREVIAPFSPEEIRTASEFRKLADLLNENKISYRSLPGGGAIDVEQIVSPVQVAASGYPSGQEPATLVLKIDYADFSFLILSDLGEVWKSNLWLEKYAGQLTNMILWDDAPVKEFKKGDAPKFVVNPLENRTFITDGYLIWSESK